jgi:subtilisin family serine protease
MDTIKNTFYKGICRKLKKLDVMKKLLKTFAILITAVSLVLVSPQTAFAVPTKSNVSNYIVVFNPGVSRAAEVADARAKGLSVSREFANAFSGMVVTATPTQLSALSKKPSVALIEPDSVVTTSETQTGATWGIDRIDQRSLPLNGMYTYVSNPGVGVRAYVIDTGVLANHADLSGRVAQGWSTLDNSTNTSDCNGHGTHVAGTLAGSTFGVAKSATIVPVRVLDCAGSGSMSGVIAGVDWAIADHQAGVPAVANLSLGGGASTALDTAIQSLTNDGVTVVVAAGNSATNACNVSPARAPSAITVAATDAADAQASFSNFGSCVDLYAPGVSITSAWYTSSTSSASLSGTSMSAPHAAGVAAVTLALKPTMTPADVTSSIITSTTQGVVLSATTGTPNRLLFISEPVTSAPVATAPASPTKVVARALPSRSASITWVQGADGGSPLTKQTLLVFLNGKLQSSVTVSATATSATVSGLSAGKKYAFAVTATNSVGTSVRSALSNTITAQR